MSAAKQRVAKPTQALPPVPDFTEDRASEQERPVIFKPFEWVDSEAAGSVQFRGSQVAGFAGRVMDLARGAHLMMSVLERDTIEGTKGDDKGAACPTMFDRPTAGVVERMCITVLEMLGDEAERMLDGVNLKSRRAQQ